MIKFYLNERELSLLNEVDLISDENEVHQLLSDQPSEIDHIEVPNNQIIINEEDAIEKSMASLTLAETDPTQQDAIEEKREKGNNAYS